MRSQSFLTVLNKESLFKTKLLTLFLKPLGGLVLFFVLSGESAYSQCGACDIVLDGGGTVSASQNLSDTKTLCIKNNTKFTGSIQNGNGSTVCVELGSTVQPQNAWNDKPNLEVYGEVILTSLFTQSGQTVNIYNGGEVTVNQLNANGAAKWNNYEGGTLIIKNNGFKESELFNQGYVYFTGGLNTEEASYIENEGWIYIKGGQFNPSGKIWNKGWVSSDDFMNYSGELINDCWLITQDAFNYNYSVKPMINKGGIWVDNASESWNNNGTSTILLGEESIIYSKGAFSNQGTVKLLDQSLPGADFYVQGVSTNNGIFGVEGDVFNFYDVGHTNHEFDTPGAGVVSTITYNMVNEPDTNSFSSSCAARVSGGGINPILDLDSNNSTTIGVNYEATYTEGSGEVAINDVDLKIDDDTDSIYSAIIVLTNPLDGTHEKLSIGTIPSGIIAVVSVGGDTITLTGEDLETNYMSAIDAIRYENTSENPTITEERVILVKVEDSEGLDASASAILEVLRSNDAPVALADTILVIEGGTQTILKTGETTVLKNDTDVDNVLADFTATVDTDVTNGTLTLNSDGTFSYTHNGGETTTDFFTYTINDGTADGDTVRVTIIISPINDLPVGVNDSLIVAEGGTQTILETLETSVLANDTDVDNVLADFTATLVTDVVNGTLTLNADGTFTYTHDGGETKTDVFTYKMFDGTDSASGVVTVNIRVTAVNDDPVAVNDTNYITEGGAPVTEQNPLSTGNILANDTDVDATDVLIVDQVLTENSSPTNGKYGTLIWDADGTYTYTLNNAAVDSLALGEIVNDEFLYVNSDQNGGTAQATLVIIITGTNNAPMAINDSVSISEGDAPVTETDGTGTLLSNDTDIDGDDLEVTSVKGDNSGTVNGVYGVLTWTSTGTYIYTLNNLAVDSLQQGEIVIDVFPYVASDGNATVSANLIVTITGTNDVPVAVDDANGMSETTDILNSTVSILDNDLEADDDDSLSVVSIEGVLTSVGTYDGVYGTITWGVDGSYSYDLDNAHVDIATMAIGEIRRDTFAYQMTDNQGGFDSAILVITITGGNAIPKANPDKNTIFEDGPSITETDGSGTLILNDTDSDGTDVLIVTEVNGNTSLTTLSPYGTLVWTDAGTYTYTLDNTLDIIQELSVGESLKDTFHYTVSDGNGGLDQSFLIITINGTNDKPVAVADTNSMLEGEISITDNGVKLILNDIDIDGDLLTVTHVNNSDNDTTRTDYGVLVWIGNGSYIYIQNQAATDSLEAGEIVEDVFTYIVSDGNGGTDTTTLTITITGINDVPVGVNDSIVVAEGGTQTVLETLETSVLANDIDAEFNTLTATLVTDVTHGTLTLNPDGTFEYIHDGSETLTDQFTYRVNDGTADGNVVLVTIRIIPVNDIPVANDDVNAITEGDGPINETDGSGNLLANDTDADLGHVLVIDTIRPEQGKYGVLTWKEDGTYIYELNPEATDSLTQGEVVLEEFTYVVDDGEGGSDEAKLTITITGINDVPVAVNDTNTINEGDDPITHLDGTGTLLSNDLDADGETLTVVSIDGNNTGSVPGIYGTLTWNADGEYTYSLNNNAVDSLQLGEEVIEGFTYTVTDGTQPVTADLIITITGTNDEPVALDDANNMSEMTDLVTSDQGSGTLLQNDFDVDDDDVLTVVSVEGVTTSVGVYLGNYGTLTWNADGTYTYDLDNALPVVAGLGEAEVLKDTFAYVMTDGQGATATADLIITITGRNSQPNALPDVNSIFEDSTSITEVDGSGILIGNDIDIDASDTLRVTKVNGNENQTTLGVYGTLTWDSTGAYTYTLDNSISIIQELGVGENETDIFTYILEDGNGGVATSTLTVTILGVNDAPIIIDPKDSTEVFYIYDTIPENTISIVEIPYIDVDDSIYTCTIVDYPIRGNATIDPITCKVTYEPEIEDTGDFTILVEVCDPHKACADVTVIITVENTNNAPVAIDDDTTVSYQGLVEIDVINILGNDDYDPDGKEQIDLSSVVIVSYPSNGEVSIHPITGVVTYTPDEGFSGEDSFEYTIKDNEGMESNIATVTISVGNRPRFDVKELITPNGDGKNDYMHIENIEYYPNTTVQIYNRWGNLVWELPDGCLGYKNGDSECSFVGKSNVGSSGSEVADGSYFYVVDGSGDGVEPCQGYVVKN